MIFFEGDGYKEKSPDKPVSVPCLLSYTFPRCYVKIMYVHTTWRHK